MPDVTNEQLTAEEIRRQLQASKDMADIEFQMDIAPYSNYTDVIDPSVTRYHGVKGLPGSTELTIGGFYAPPNVPEAPWSESDFRPYKGMVDGIEINIPKEPGTINAIHSLATPEVWAHEDRHKKHRGLSEKQNRMMDAATAQGPRDWERAIEMWRDQLLRQKKKGDPKPTRSEAERDLLETLNTDAGNGTFSVMNRIFENERSLGGNLPSNEKTLLLSDDQDYTRMRKDNSYWKKRKNELDEFDSWVNELEERNQERQRQK